MIDAKQLQTFDIVRKMSPSIVKSLAEHGETMIVETGGTVLKQEDPAQRLYGLISGEAELRFLFRDRILKLDVQYEESVVRRWETVDTSIVLETFEPGSIFGWSSMVGGKTYTASVICTAESKLWAINGEVLRSLLDSEPTMGYVFMDYLANLIAQRLAWRTDKLVESWAEAFGSPRVE
jgi:CRP-like cAMP-binding protein